MGTIHHYVFETRSKNKNFYNYSPNITELKNVDIVLYTVKFRVIGSWIFFLFLIKVIIIVFLGKYIQLNNDFFLKS